MKAFESRLISIFLMLLSTTACGGGGGGGEDNVAPGAQAPTASITSPSVGGLTDEPVLTVRGTGDKGGGTISAVRVNGKSATSSDGFESWAVSIVLAKGTNMLTLDVVDGSGNTTSVVDSRVITRTDPLLIDPSACLLELSKNRALIADVARHELLSVDLSTGARKVLSGQDVGKGPLFENARDLILDAANKRVLLLDLFFDTIFEIDLDTGERSVLFTLSSSETPSLETAVAMAFGSDPDKLLIASVFEGLLELELSTGKLSVLSKDEPGLGPPLGSVRGMVYDESSGLAYLTDDASKSIFSVDVATGKRFLVSKSGVEPGPPLVFPSACDLDSILGLVVADGNSAVIAVNLGNGARTTISDANTGLGESFGIVSDLRVANGKAYLADRKKNALVEVDLATGDRTPLGATTVGAGSFMSSVLDLSPSPDGRVLTPISDFGSGELAAMDPLTGSRQVISGPGLGTGDPFGSIRSVDINPFTLELLVTDSAGQLFVVDAQTGERTLVANEDDAGIGTLDVALWAPLQTLQAVFVDNQINSLVSLNLITGNTSVLAGLPDDVEDFVFDPVNNRFLAITRRDLLAIDAVSGNVQTITKANNSIGSGEFIDTLSRVEVDGELGVAYLRDLTLDKIIAVDLTTGVRTLVSDNFKGAGPPLSGIGGIALSADRKTLFAYSSRSASILAITIETGDRLVVSL